MKKSGWGTKVMIAAVLLLIMSVTACSGMGTDTSAKTVKLDPKNPVSVTVWHYYNGPQQVVFDEMLTEFNNTVGNEKGIFIQGKGQGDVSQLEEAVMAALNNQVGSEDMPNIYSSYADTAYAVEQMGQLADISQYLTEEELAAYVDSYIEEGKIGLNGELRIFPIAKSSEIFMMNKTDWDKFAAATGADVSSLSTKEGLAETAKAYYEWTDSLTPDIPGDGKSFYGRDAMANLFIIGSMQLGVELFEVNNGQVTLHVDRDVMRKIWDYYYANYIRGYFGAYGRFRSDDVKINEIIAFTGSTTSSMYFPDEVELEEGSYPIDYMVLTEPLFANGEKYVVQQGAGMVVTKADPAAEYASVLFLKWLTEKENNLEFSVSSSYLPVRKDAYDMEIFDRVIAEKQIEVSDKTYDTIALVIDNIQDYTLYTNKAFDGGSEARKVLDSHMTDKAAADREAVLEQLRAGVTMEKATAEFLTDEAFEEWFADFSAALQSAVQGAN